ncbi:MAG TPA: efflux RND transporter periplasmic adaptor subunit [Kofleriaceae bacterium]|nr:efflux RND transporter periplasmic adaptor subunit [Kofleriaceae bacterium]
MTNDGMRARARKYAVPIAWIGALLIAALIFHSPLIAWFQPGDGEDAAAEATPSPGHGGGHGGTTAGNAAGTHTFAPAARIELERALAGYEGLRVQLAADQTGGVSAPARNVASAMRAAKTADEELPAALSSHLTAGADAADALGQATELAAARAAFATLSEHLVAAVAADPTVAGGVHLFACPMTQGYNKWLQPNEKLENPYKGAEMLTCGSEVPLSDAAPEPEAHAHDPDEIAHYTCPMDTWVKQKTAGACPVCGMPLIPVTQEEVRTGVMRIDHRRRQLIGLKTALVERRDLTLEVRAVGRVSYDETRIAEVALKYDGWIQKLHVEQTGQAVRKGQPLFTLYSPELYTAQQEYLLALSQQATARDDVGRARGEALVRGARRRLELWDVTKGQLAAIAKRGEPLQYLPVLAPASGYVVAKDVVEGAAVKAGQRLFRIAALDRVWVEADIYEKDIPLVKVGQQAMVTLTHLPGRTFEGKIAFIYPYLDPSSRTSRARVELANSELELKPDMYASVELRVPLGERLVVPEAAVIYSGPRRIVFLDMDDDKLRPKPIEVGVKAGGYFEVLSGLAIGDRVVTSGNFLLSAESRLKAATGLW